MVRESYTSFAAMIHINLPKGKNLLAQHRLIENRVKGRQVDISETTIHRMLFGQEFLAPRSTTEFDYKVGQTRNLMVIRDL